MMQDKVAILPETMMTDSPPPAQANLFPKTVGERLREAREAQALSLAEVATRTRVPLRHLEAIEDDNYALLPSVTYAVGFAKAYARVVGLDEVTIAREVRGKLGQSPRPAIDYQPYVTEDPSRMPSRGVMIFGVIVAAVLLAGAVLWYGTTLFRGGGAPAAPVASEAQVAQTMPAAAPAPAPTPATGGQVRLTATDTVWLRIYDSANKTLLLKTLKPGETYDVPQDASNPMINVGRPDELTVTVNGQPVPPLGDGKRAIKDVGISAAALAARGAPKPAATATPAASSPTPRPTHTPRAKRTPSASSTVPPYFATPAPSGAAPAPAPTPAAPPPAATSGTTP